MSESRPVAGRELFDLADRLLRVHGLDPGAAGRIAAAVVFGERHGHRAANELLNLIDGSGLGDLLDAYRVIDRAEATVRRDGSASVQLEPPVSEALLLGPLAEAAGRGIRRFTSSAVDGRVDALDLGIGDVEPAASAPVDLRLPAELFDELSRRAASFLVPEADIDR